MARHEPPAPASGGLLMAFALVAFAFVAVAIIAGAVVKLSGAKGRETAGIATGEACMAAGHTLSDCAVICEVATAGRLRDVNLACKRAAVSALAEAP